MAAHRGRPLTFDPDMGLVAARELFERQGYVATSISQLSKAMGTSPPSIYTHFGNKCGLYERVIGSGLDDLWDGPFKDEGYDTKEAIRVIFEIFMEPASWARRFGKLLVSDLLLYSEEDRPAAQIIHDARLQVRGWIKNIFTRGALRGELPMQNDQYLASVFTSLLYGIIVQGKSGGDEVELTKSFLLTMRLLR